MVSLTAALFKTVIGDADIAEEDVEAIIDLAISGINLYGINVDLPLMGGITGTKTVTLETREYAAVMEVARTVYYAFYKGLENVTVSGMSVSLADLKSNAVVQATVEKVARLLSDVDIDYG